MNEISGSNNLSSNNFCSSSSTLLQSTKHQLLKYKNRIRGQHSSILVSGSIVLLLFSGVLHLAWFSLSGSEWEGPVSLRKPALFGVSAGLTLWSLAYIADRLSETKGARAVRDLVAICLLLEVALITTAISSRGLLTLQSQYAH